MGKNWIKIICVQFRMFVSLFCAFIDTRFVSGLHQIWFSHCRGFAQLEGSQIKDWGPINPICVDDDFVQGVVPAESCESRSGSTFHSAGA